MDKTKHQPAAAHDPIDDPAPGDRLEKNDEVFTVMAILDNGDVAVQIDNSPKNIIIPRKQWREVLRGARILDPSDPHPLTPPHPRRRAPETVTITAHRLRRYEAAENVARLFRKIITQRADVPYADKARLWEKATDWLGYWGEFSTKEFCRPPEVPPVPARWKYNREQAMLGWPDKQKRSPR